MKYISYQRDTENKVGTYTCRLCSFSFDMMPDKVESRFIHDFIDDHLKLNHQNICYECSTCYEVLTNKVKLIKKNHGCDYSKREIPKLLNLYMCKDLMRLTMEYLSNKNTCPITHLLYPSC